MSGLVLVLEDDLFFGSRVENGLRANGYQGRFATDASQLGEALKAAPVLVLVNVGSQRMPWPRLVELAKERRLPPQSAVVGYGPHVDLELRQRALDAGCDAVVARSAVANNLGALIGRHAWKPDLSACDSFLPAGILRGIEQFNRREFYDCHDSIEKEWVNQEGDIRLLYQGLLQIGVAFHHVQNANRPGMVKMMNRGKGKLLPFLPVCQRVELHSLLSDVQQCELALGKLSVEEMVGFDGFPTIHLSPRDATPN